MAGAKRILDLAVVLAALVGVMDQQGDRRSGRHLLAAGIGEDAGEYLHRVGFTALGGEARLSGFAPVQLDLDFLGCDRNARRAAIDDAADGGPMAFAPGGHAEKMAEGVV